jgi:hypothetical protein
MNRVDPAGVLFRKSKPIRRRQYNVQGVHHLWHLDGNHKLDEYGIVIHGCVDGYSRFVCYLVATDNNRADTVLRLFRTTCSRLGIIPSRVRGDKGGENVRVADYMILHRGEGRGSYLAGSSRHNTRIERLWRDVRQQVTQRYMDLLDEWQRDPDVHLDSSNLLHVYVLHRLMLPLLNAALQQLVCSWNHHKVRSMGYRTPAQVEYLDRGTAPDAPPVVDEEVYGVEEDDGEDEDDEEEADQNEEMQVVVEQIPCPLNEEALAVFDGQVPPWQVQDTNVMLRMKFIHAVQCITHLYHGGV